MLEKNRTKRRGRSEHIRGVEGRREVPYRRCDNRVHRWVPEADARGEERRGVAPLRARTRVSENVRVHCTHGAESCGRATRGVSHGRSRKQKANRAHRGEADDGRAGGPEDLPRGADDAAGNILRFVQRGRRCWLNGGGMDSAGVHGGEHGGELTRRGDHAGVVRWRPPHRSSKKSADSSILARTTYSRSRRTCAGRGRRIMWALYL